VPPLPLLLALPPLALLAPLLFLVLPLPLPLPKLPPPPPPRGIMRCVWHISACPPGHSTTEPRSRSARRNVGRDTCFGLVLVCCFVVCVRR
jgi:hypothetical protein